MADDEIVVPIKLEGGETVAQQLAKIGEQGAAAFKPLNDALKDTSERLTSLSDSLQQVKTAGSEVAPGGGGGRGILGFLFGAGSGAAAEREIEGTTSAAHRLREGIHVIRPALEEAGVGLGGFGALATVARLGVGGLIAAVSGAALVGLANLDDRAQKTRRGLSDLFQNPRTGNALYKDLDDQAQKFGTSAETFTAPLGALVRGARQTGDAYPQVDLYARALTSLYAAMKAGGTSNEDATKGLNDFAEGLAKAGKLTPELLQGLEDLSQRGADAVANALGRVNADQFIEELKKGTTEGIGSVITGLSNFTDQNKKAFDAAAADTRTYHDALSQLGTNVARDIKDITGQGPDKLLQNVVDTGNALFQSVADYVKRLKGIAPTTAASGLPGSITVPPGGKPEPFPGAATPERIESPVPVEVVPPTEGAGTEASPFTGSVPVPPSGASILPGIGALLGAGSLAGLGVLGTAGAATGVGLLAALAGTVRPQPAGETDAEEAARRERELAESGTAPFPLTGGPAVPIPSGLSNLLPAETSPQLTTGAPLGGVTQPVESALTGVASGISGAGSELVSALSALAASLANNLPAVFQRPEEPAGGSAGGATGGLFTGLSFMRFAPGGPVGGVGTGKSDSNLALLSRGEFVHQEAAVQHYGHAFMHAVNNMTFPKFSLGGLMDGISSSMNFGVPRLAAGGVASSGSANYLGHYTVDLRTDKGTVSGLRGGQDVVDQLSKSAVNRQMRTTFTGGGAPDWYGGRNS